MLIYLTDFLITAPGNLPKLELMMSGGKTEEQIHEFIFVVIYKLYILIY